MKHRQSVFFSGRNNNNNNNNEEQLELNFFDILPTEIIKEILTYLSSQELCKIAMVSKKLKALSEEDVLWDRFLKEEPYSAYKDMIESWKTQKISSKKIFSDLEKLLKNKSFSSSLKKHSNDLAYDFPELEKKLTFDIQNDHDLVGADLEEEIMNDIMNQVKHVLGNIKEDYNLAMLEQLTDFSGKDLKVDTAKNLNRQNRYKGESFKFGNKSNPNCNNPDLKKFQEDDDYKDDDQNSNTNTSTTLS